jgi:hypothetical protein
VIRNFKPMIKYIFRLHQHARYAPKCFLSNQTRSDIDAPIFRVLSTHIRNVAIYEEILVEAEFFWNVKTIDFYRVYTDEDLQALDDSFRVIPSGIRLWVLGAVIYAVRTKVAFWIKCESRTHTFGWFSILTMIYYS